MPLALLEEKFLHYQWPSDDPINATKSGEGLNYERNLTTTKKQQIYRADKAAWMPMPAERTDKVVHNWSTTTTAFRCKMLKIISPEQTPPQIVTQKETTDDENTFTQA